MTSMWACWFWTSAPAIAVILMFVIRSALELVAERFGSRP